MASLSPESIHTVCKNLSQTETSYEQYKSYWRSLNTQRKEGVLCNVVIQCGNYSYHAHKCVLAAASPYFKALFTSSVSNADKQQIVHFDHYSKETVQLLLNIIYGEYTVESADFSEMLQLAEFLQYDMLISILIESIRSTIDETNCFLWHRIGRESGVRKLVVLAEAYITVNHNKLICLEEHKTCINNILTQREPIMDEHVILYHNNDSVYVIDMPKKTVKKSLEGPCNLTKLLPPIPPPDHPYPCIFSFFMYNKELFLASYYELGSLMIEEYKSNYVSVNFEKNSKILLNKYNNCSQEYQQVHTIVDPYSNVHFEYTTGAMEYVTQLVYNNMNDLYILIEDGEGQHALYKFDLIKGCCSDNYIMLNIDARNLTFVESKQLGTLLINGMEEVYNLEKFDFNDEFNHSLDPLPIKLDLMKSKVKNSNSQVNSQNLIYKAWRVVSLNGEIYFFVVFKQDKWKLNVLRLNVREMSWLYLCDFPLSGDLKNVFLYHDKIYVVVSSMEHAEYCSCKFEENCYLSELKSTHKKENIFNCLYYFDHDKGTLADMDMKVPLTQGPYKFAVLPAYLLV